MIRIKNEEEMEGMRAAGKLAAVILDAITPKVVAGVSTQDINDWIDKMIIEAGAIPAPLNYRGFPKSICTSVNSVVCHGIPSPTDVLRDGDIVNVDITVILNGWHGDTSRTYMIGDVAPELKKLVERTYEAMWRGIEVIRPGQKISAIGEVIEQFIKPFGYAIVEDYGGHGIGREFHEDPHIYHFSTKSKQTMKAGMTFTVEPMINLGGSPKVHTSEVDGWTVTTSDNKPSAQFEHTVAVTSDGFEVLTLSKYESRK
jgi:methionyl aminopeptidase